VIDIKFSFKSEEIIYGCPKQLKLVYLT